MDFTRTQTSFGFFSNHSSLVIDDQNSTWGKRNYPLDLFNLTKFSCRANLVFLSIHFSTGSARNSKWYWSFVCCEILRTLTDPILLLYACVARFKFEYVLRFVQFDIEEKQKNL